MVEEKKMSTVNSLSRSTSIFFTLAVVAVSVYFSRFTLFNMSPSQIQKVTVVGVSELGAIGRSSLLPNQVLMSCICAGKQVVLRAEHSN